MKEKIKDIITTIVAFLFTIVGDLVFIYSLIFFIINKIDWYYILLLTMICGIVLFFFNRGCIDIIKSYKINKNKK